MLVIELTSLQNKCQPQDMIERSATEHLSGVFYAVLLFDFYKWNNSGVENSNKSALKYQRNKIAD